MRNLVYIESRRGDVHFFEYDASSGRLTFAGEQGGTATFNRARELLRSRLRASGTDIRVPNCVEGVGAEGNTYSCFRCSGCHRLVQVVRDHQSGLKRAKHDAVDYDCLYEPFPPLNAHSFAGISDSCWGQGPCVS